MPRSVGGKQNVSLGPGCEGFILPIDHGWISGKCFRMNTLRVESGLENDHKDQWIDVMI